MKTSKAMKTKAREELAAAEKEAQALGDFFDLDRALNRMMDRTNGGHEYQTRDAAYDDWHLDQRLTEERGCYAAAADARTLARVQATLSVWVADSRRVKLIMEHLALPGEMRLVKLIRLDACRQRLSRLRERDGLRQA